LAAVRGSSSRARDVATYLYGVVRASAPPDAASLPRGLPDLSAPRVLAVEGDVWLVAADAPLAVYGAQTIGERLADLAWVSARAVAHDAVVERCGRAGPVIPMKSFTLFADDVRAIAHVRGELPRLVEIFRRIAGRQEWGVRVHRTGAPAADDAGEPPSTGTEFLARKKARRDTARETAAAGLREVEGLYTELAACSADAVRHAPPVEGVALLLDAAFLVAEADAPGFQRRVESGARRLRECGCAVTLTGPWPPYNFVEERPREPRT
jgi:hypothetical protein